MSWRTVVIQNHCKLDLKMGHMVVRGEETKRIFLDEIAVLIIESTAVSLTAALIAELADRKIKVIFCDEKRSPSCELVSYYGSHDTSAKIRTQIIWGSEIKADIWTEIVSEKIRNQAWLLKYFGKNIQSEMLFGYLSELQHNDSTNREGHAAKVYFNALFGQDFSRAKDTPVNRALNYGYSILLSAFNREIVSNGYLTQLGLFHDNMFNHFNLSSDMMEPFRFLVDKKVIENKWSEFDSQEKYALVDILNEYVTVNGTNQTVMNAVKIYVKSVFNAINERDVSQIKFISL